MFAASVPRLMFVHHFLRSGQATTATPTHRHLQLHLAERGGAAIQRFANLTISNAVADADIHGGWR